MPTAHDSVEALDVTLSKALRLLPMSADLLKEELAVLQRGVEAARQRQLYRLHVTGDWWSSPPILWGHLVAYYRLAMVRLLVWRGDSPRLRRHLERLAQFTAVLRPRR